MWIKLFLLLFSVSCFAGTGEQSFTPSKIQFWVEKITLSSGMSSDGIPNGEQLTLHECLSSDCYITVSDNDLLSQLSGNKQIKAGTYRYLTVQTCSGNKTFFLAKLRGSVTMDGKEYYSHSSEGLLEKVGNETEQDVTMSFTQCNYYYELQSDIQFSDSTVTPLTLFMDLNNIAWGRVGVQSIESGCFQGDVGSDGVVASVCMGVPHMIPVASSSTPTIQRFHIYNSGKNENTAGGMMVFFLNDQGDILGGFSRRLFNEFSEAPQINAFDMAFKRVVLLNTGAYQIETFGNTFNSTYLNFPQFSLNTHTTSTYLDSSNTSFTYESKKQ
ncbi:MAG: hypothetical protein VW397_03265 [Candidatus Margulisiibacteriota bacterium]